MSIRRINSTGRIKILRQDVRISVDEEAAGELKFNARFDLAKYRLPGDANVFIEAYRQTTFMRFAFGTVNQSGYTLDSVPHLTEFSSKDGILFRLKVTSAGTPAGMLLAQADRIPVTDEVEEPDNRIPLLPTMPAELGQEVWRVDGLDSTSGPMLQINSGIGDWKATASSVQFRSLVYPSAMSQILWYICKVEKTREMEDDEDWKSLWLQFAASLPGVGNPPLSSEDDEEWGEWIRTAVESFSRKHRFFDQYRAFLSEATE